MELWDSNPEHEEEIPGNPFGQTICEWMEV